MAPPLVPTLEEPEQQPMKRLEGSPNEEGTCMQIIPMTGSTDAWTHSQVTCSTDAHSCSTKTHSHGSQVETQQPPLKKVASGKHRRMFAWL